jgi:hypothetical protein
MKIKPIDKNQGLSDKALTYILTSLSTKWANQMPTLEDKEAYADIIDKYYKKHNMDSLCERPWRKEVILE